MAMCNTAGPAMACPSIRGRTRRDGRIKARQIQLEATSGPVAPGGSRGLFGELVMPTALERSCPICSGWTNVLSWCCTADVVRGPDQKTQPIW